MNRREHLRMLVALLSSDVNLESVECRALCLPFDSSKYAMKWDGEWHITNEVFQR